VKTLYRGTYWKGALIGIRYFFKKKKNGTQGEAIFIKGARIGRRVLNRIITVIGLQLA
jgi:hypothetical protein